MREFGVSANACTKLFKRFRDFESQNFEYLEQWLRQNNYAYRIEWGK